jgi:hypothetical protein
LRLVQLPHVGHCCIAVKVETGSCTLTGAPKKETKHLLVLRIES